MENVHLLIDIQEVATFTDHHLQESKTKYIPNFISTETEKKIIDDSQLKIVEDFKHL